MILVERQLVSLNYRKYFCTKFLFINLKVCKANKCVLFSFHTFLRLKPAINDFYCSVLVSRERLMAWRGLNVSVVVNVKSLSSYQNGILNIQTSIAKRSVLTRNTFSLLMNIKESDRDAFNISTTPDALTISTAVLIEKWKSKTGEMRHFTFPVLLRFYFECWAWCRPRRLLLLSQRLYSMNTHTHTHWHRNTHRATFPVN